MAYDRSPVPWTDEEWARVERTIQEEASRARVAATFLPLYGPLPPDTDFVRVQRLREPSGNGHLTIDDKTTVQLATLQVRVHLRGAQMADPELGSALQLFRRAANVLARLEDLVVFRGVKEGDTEASSDAPRLEPAGGIQSVPPIWQIRGEKVSEGLWTVASGEPTATEPARQPRTIEGEDRNQRGESLVSEWPLRPVRRRAGARVLRRGRDAELGLARSAAGSHHPVPWRRFVPSLIRTRT
jgi:hypothetical protein